MSFLFPKQKPQPAVVMPDSQAPDVLEAARQQRIATIGRGGRASTILSGSLGGSNSASATAPVFSNSTLGGAS